MWEMLKIEHDLQERLKLKGSSGDVLWSKYIAAREFLVSQVLQWIKSSEPSLSDHGPDHIRNVLENAYHLLGPNHDLNVIELYILCQAILFHDVGNIFGRKSHNQKIHTVYGAAFSGLWQNRQEMSLVVSIGRSHSGKGSDGSSDTLKEVKDDFIFGESVRVQCLAAILRFADELAEGPQRTSAYMLSIGGIAAESVIFHEYAKITQLHIDLGGGRIALTYHIELDGTDFGNPESADALKELIEFTYSRIHKLDDERRYCKHYSDHLSRFKKTSVQFNFWKGSERHDSIGPPIELDDLFIPGRESKKITDAHPEYDIQVLISKLKELI